MFELKINNYRSFLNQDFSFKRINILIGENSSGKSSLIKFFLILKQSLNNFRNAILTVSGEEVDLGNFKDLIYYHDDNKSLEFQFGINDGFFAYCNDFLKDKKDKTIKEENLPFFHLKKHFDSTTFISIEIKKDVSTLSSLYLSFHNESLGTLGIFFAQGSDTIDNEFQITKVNLVYKNYERKKEYLLNSISFDNNAFFNIVHGNDLLKKITDNYPDETYIYTEIAMLLLSQNYTEEILKSMTYVNPISSTPERIYYKRDQRRYNNSIDIQTLISALQDNRIFDIFKKKIIPIIKEFGLAEDIDILNNDQLPVVELKAKIKDLWSNINDVGYGVAIQLPILLHSFLMESTKSGKTVIIEQPEVHLHPKLQAKFIESLLKIGRKNRYIIETHSEHILRKLQSISKNRLYGITKEDISIYYFRRIDKKFEITSHKITESGNINPPFPEGFYDTSFNLAKDLLL